MRIYMAVAMFCLTCTACPAEPMPERRDNDIFLNIGSSSTKTNLGYGWGRGERHGEMNMRWVRRLEADVKFHVDEATDMDVWVSAAPITIEGLRQNFGMFINNRYVTEWECPDEPAMHDYHAEVPAQFFRKGENVLTLRMGHLRVPPGDQRYLSLAVDKILCRPKTKQADR